MAAIPNTEFQIERARACRTTARARFVKEACMELTAAHLRYLLAIYETARTQLDVSSRTSASWPSAG